MFTGIIEGQAKVMKFLKARQGAILTLHVPSAYRRTKTGASISVDGVCLTVTGRAGKPSRLSFDLVPETLKRTYFSELCSGDILNLERPLKWKGRVDGHLVQGHVDGVAKVVKISRQGRGKSFQLRVPKKLKRALMEKGSVALNGVSLTVGKTSSGFFWVHGIPHTLKRTNMRLWKPGKKVNFEADWMLKAKSHVN